MLAQSIPVLDLNHFTSGSAEERSTFIQTMGSALEDTGFFALINHGVEPELIEKAYAVAEAFFQLPDEVKQQYEIPALKGQRGFTSFGKEHAKNHPVPDLKEFWHIGREFPLSHPLAKRYPQNLIPTEVPAFHLLMAQLYAQLEVCAVQLLEACAVYLGEPRELFRAMAEQGDSILRVVHYPPLPPDVDANSLRAAPHEDINLITLLCEATADGLELLQQDGSWLPVSTTSGQIVVDSGDMLQQLTNGLFKSTTHRVTNPDNDRTRRFSLPFFVHPRAEVDLTPLPSCVAKTGGQLKFPSLTAGEYLQQRLHEIGLAS
jgi:isopenicillin N synthase-like dioxygenase